MKNLINLNSAEWCDIIFENKNKEYGAYAMRQTSTKRHVVAFCIIIAFVVVVAFLPYLIESVKAATNQQYGGYTETYSTMLVENKVETLEPEVAKPEVPEPPKFVNMTKFVPPTIVEDKDASAETEMATMSDIANSTDAVGAFTVTNGSEDKDAIRKTVEEVMGSGTAEAIAPPQTLIKAEIMPQFPGGEVEMYKFIGDNLKYPVVDQEMGIQGRVTVRFVVSKTGEISGIELLKGISSTCDKEAMRVIKSMPRWIPGKQNGEPVQVYFTMPILFRLKS